MPPKHKPVQQDAEAADLLQEEPKDSHTPIPKVGVCLKYGSIFIVLALTTAMLTFCVVMEQKEEAIEQQVALLARTQLKNAHRTGRMLNQLLTRETDLLGPSVVTESDIGALCKSKKCGLACAHGKTKGYATFLDGLTQNLPQVLNLIPGIGSQLSSLSQMAIGVSEKISESDGFKLNGRDCAAEMLDIFKKNRMVAALKKVREKAFTDQRSPIATGSVNNRGKRSTATVDPLRLSKEGEKGWMLRFRRSLIGMNGEDERLRDLLELETGFHVPHTTDHYTDLMDLISRIFAAAV
jgi:hypothetical protein